jgi:hypothetical protein
MAASYNSSQLKTVFKNQLRRSTFDWEVFMEEVSSPLERVIVNRSSWSAIWAGVFTFIAIWSVFGALGYDIFFASSRESGGGYVGMEIWGVILTIIAMFVAGRITAALAGVTDSRGGIAHGMVMFGLSVVSVLLLLIMSESTANTTATMHTYVIDVFHTMGWSLFIGLFLGWLAALGGASTAHKQFPSSAPMQQQVHHA